MIVPPPRKNNSKSEVRLAARVVAGRTLRYTRSGGCHSESLHGYLAVSGAEKAPAVSNPKLARKRRAAKLPVPIIAVIGTNAVT